MEVQKMDLQKKLDFIETYRMALSYRKHKEPAITYEWISQNPTEEQKKEAACEPKQNNR